MSGGSEVRVSQQVLMGAQSMDYNARFSVSLQYTGKTVINELAGLSSLVLAQYRSRKYSLFNSEPVVL